MNEALKQLILPKEDVDSCKNTANTHLNTIIPIHLPVEFYFSYETFCVSLQSSKQFCFIVQNIVSYRFLFGIKAKIIAGDKL